MYADDTSRIRSEQGSYGSSTKSRDGVEIPSEIA